MPGLRQPLEGYDQAPPLSEPELEQLIEQAPAPLRRALARLCAEVKTLRDQQAEREFFASQEQEW